jgi:uncharacterized protein (TIGR02118 family)
MIKSLVFFRRRPGLDVETFRRHWQTTHRDLVTKIPGVRRYVQHPVDDSGYRHHDPVYDGVAELCFDDMDAVRALDSDGAVAAVLADEDNFIDADSRGQILAEEVVVVDGAPRPGSLTMFAFINRLPGSDPARFSQYWRETHGPIAARVPGLVRYVQNHVLSGIYRAGREPVYDGIPQTWFDDLEAMRVAAPSPELAATRADEPNFMVTGNLPFVICTPIEIV